MTENWKSTSQKVKDLEALTAELRERIQALENPRRNPGKPPQPVHSAPKPPAAPRSQEEIIADMKKYKAR